VWSRAGSPSGRLDFLDEPRGIAVALALVQHIGEVTGAGAPDVGRRASVRTATATRRLAV